MDTLLIPILNGEQGDITDGNNYRPIAITCVASKILELDMLDKFLDRLETTCNQFGLGHDYPLRSVYHLILQTFVHKIRHTNDLFYILYNSTYKLYS